MYESAFNIIVLGARYFFVVLILYILLRVVLHSVTEFKSIQSIKKQVRGVSPGCLVVSAPADLAGKRFELARENSIGSLARSDICIEHKSIAPTHAFIYEKKQYLYIMDYGNSPVSVNNEQVKKREERLYNEDEIMLGEVSLLLHLSDDEDYEDYVKGEGDAQ